MTPQFIAQMVAGIVPALEPLVTTIEGLTRTSPAETATITAALADLKTLAASLATAPTVAATAPILAQIQAYAQEILTAASGMALPYPASMYLQIGSSVVMMAFSIVNTILSAQPPAVTPAAAPKAKR